MEQTPEQIVEALNKNIAELKTTIETKASGEDVVSTSKEVAELKATLEGKVTELDSLKASMIEQGNTITELQNKTVQSQTIKVGSIEDQLRAAIEADQEGFKAFKEKRSNSFKVELKAAGNMTIAGNVTPDAINVASTSVVPGYVDILPVNPLFDTLTNTGNTDSSIIQYIEKVNRDGTTIFIGEGDAKNQIDFDWKKNTSTAKKVADYIKVSEEMLDDISFMASAIENELRYQINLKTSSEILAGVGTGDFLKGITQYAQAYTLTTVLTTAPNTYDVLKAMATQVTVNNGTATHAVLNPIDYVNMGIAKGTTAFYVIIDGFVQQLPFMVVQSNQIPVGYALVADMSKSIVRNYKAFTVDYGHDASDFTTNMVTVRGERRVHHYIADNHTPCFVYDAISDVVTAITV